ncbi:MAG: oligopeptide transporter, OPT family, partial [Candidatus Eremiobacteraeota bacterium]|nr:oligopeptide transporter, OPT family [Candidatus Eremiobacteraeota bacterium]
MQSRRDGRGTPGAWRDGLARRGDPRGAGAGPGRVRRCPRPVRAVGHSARADRALRDGADRDPRRRETRAGAQRAAGLSAAAAARQRRVELTWRGVALGAAITLVFTAANVYLGLKVGLTFASSIPAAVISMAILRAFRDATIWENNIVQTVASAAGTLSSIIFVLPGLVMVGWWTGFPYWESFGICLVGGILGVMYSVPLRRAMVTGSSLPYPEGVAAAGVLEVGSGVAAAGADAAAAAAENRAGLVAIVWSSIASAL